MSELEIIEQNIIKDKSYYETLQKEEIEGLTYIYPKEVKLLKSTSPFKLQVNIKAFLEDEWLVYPNTFKNVEALVVIELGEKYPLNQPIIKIFSSENSIIKIKALKDFEFMYSLHEENKGEGFILIEIIERIRQIIYDFSKENCKKFHLIRHTMDEEVSEDFTNQKNNENYENLIKKETFTPVTAESFQEWNQKFLLQLAMSDKNKNKDKARDRPSGKEIFMVPGGENIMNEVENDDDAEEFLLENNQKVRIEEGIFEEEDLLDNLDEFN